MQPYYSKFAFFMAALETVVSTQSAMRKIVKGQVFILIIFFHFRLDNDWLTKTRITVTHNALVKPDTDPRDVTTWAPPRLLISRDI